MSGVDVLAVMDRLAIAAARERDEHDANDNKPAADGWERHRADARKARAAVAELIAEAKKPAVAYGCLSLTGIHFGSDDRDDCVEESRRDGSLVVELIVRPFALARCGGAK